MSVLESEEFSRAQKAVLRNPAIWILALSSAFMYISRYAVNSWGVFYLEAQKGYSTLDASFIISISSVCGIVGTMFPVSFRTSCSAAAVMCPPLSSD